MPTYFCNDPRRNTPQSTCTPVTTAHHAVVAAPIGALTTKSSLRRQPAAACSRQVQAIYKTLKYNKITQNTHNYSKLLKNTHFSCIGCDKQFIRKYNLERQKLNSMKSILVIYEYKVCFK